MKAVKRPAKKSGQHQRNAAGPSSSAASSVPPVLSTPTTIEIDGVPVHFPFKPYECQETYMEKVLDALHRSENALLESPTGTGKTLCLLCATLAWQRQQARSLPQNSQMTQSTSVLPSQADTTEPIKPHRVPTIIYASRTHSQLSQVVRELRNTRYRPKHAVLGSREQMCVNPKVKKANATASDINYDCNKMSKDRKCRFRNNLEGFVAPRNESFQHYQVQSVMDMEDLVAMGTSEKVCPFYYTRSLVSDAELILVPYNYLFDKDAREGTLAEVPWDNAVVIFDEAHNLESFASESASFDLSSADIAGCMHEITRVMNYVQAMPELGERISLDNLIRLKALFMNLEEYMLQRIPEDRRVYSGEKMMEVFRDGMSINHANHAIFLNEVRKLDDITMEMRSGQSKGNPKLDAFTTCIKRVFDETSEARCLAKARNYRVHISPKEKNGRTISYWCFAPSLAMQELSDLNVRSIIVTSGTLSPLPSYSMELGLPFPNTVENPHIIANHQIHVRVIGHGVSGKLLNSSYNRRDDAEYLAELGNTLASLAKIVPGGMLVFFPSYGVMEACIERWGGPSRKFRPNENRNSKFFQARGGQKSSPSHQFSFPHSPSYGSSAGSNSTPWKRLLTKKAIILEPRTTSELPDAIADFHKYLNMPKSTGCVLMGVCRGKISEGIDFAHNMCRAVIITGIPFAPYLDPKVKLKREYLDGLRASQSVRPTGDGGFGGDGAASSNPLPVTLSGAEWYTQQAHRAVNQAVGRVIRNKSDYGAVLLLDSRFGEERNQQGLSKWVRPHVQPDDGFGPSFAALTKFYREAEKHASELQKKDQPAPVKAGVLLQYENETDKMPATSTTDTVTKIAVVQNVASRTDDADDGIDDVVTQSYIPPERVIARMDLNQKESAKDISGGTEVASQLHRSTVRSKGTLTLDDVYRNGNASTGKQKSIPPTSTGDATSAWSSIEARRKDSNQVSSGIEARRALRETTSNERACAVSKPKKKSPAVLFFEKLQSCATKDELSHTKKAIITMKKHGEKNDVRAYLQAAESALEVLVRHENFDKDNGKGGMLDLFFVVLPKARQADVRRLCLRMKFRKSLFNESCRREMNKEDYNHLISLVTPLMLSLHCGSSNERHDTLIDTDYIRDCKPILEILRQYENKRADGQPKITLTKLFLRLMPARLQGPTLALLDTKQSVTKVAKIKAMEKASMGEEGLETFRFNKSESLKPSLSGTKREQSESTPEFLESQMSMEAALMQAEVLNKAKRERIQSSNDLPLRKRASVKNPYSSTRTIPTKPKNESRPSRVASANVPGDQRHRKKQRLGSQPSLSGSIGNTTPKNSKDKPCDPIAQCLHQVESDSYVKRAFGAVNSERQIESNAPADLKCGLCEQESKTVRNDVN